jgi:hypothetical protein
MILGIFSVYLAVFNYLADTYQVYASSAIAAQLFTRNVFAACLPLATDKMFEKLGFKDRHINISRTRSENENSSLKGHKIIRKPITPTHSMKL